MEYIQLLALLSPMCINTTNAFLQAACSMGDSTM